MSGKTASATSTNTAGNTTKKQIGIVLFDQFETLDVFGPVEMWGGMPDYEMVMVSQQGGLVRSSQGIETQTSYGFETAPQFDILMVPGGMGTRSEINNPAMLAFHSEAGPGNAVDGLGVYGGGFIGQGGCSEAAAGYVQQAGV